MRMVESFEVSFQTGFRLLFIATIAFQDRDWVEILLKMLKGSHIRFALSIDKLCSKNLSLLDKDF